MHPNVRNFLFVLLLFVLNSDRISAFSARCASVGPAGDVTITWDRNGLNPADYRAWYLYYSISANGPFTPIDSTFIFSDTIQTDPAANAANQSAYYYLSFRSLSGAPITSDTIRAIGMNVVNPNNGFANLSWSPTHVPLIATNLPFYRIFREYPAGTFTLVDSIDARTAPVPMTYSDLISICDDTIKYRIEVMDQSGCVSSSAIKGDRFKDLQPPSRPQIDSISVDINGNVVVAWTPSTSLDTRLYQVLQNVGGLWVAIDTVYGRTSSFYASTVSAANGSISFQLIAKDSCNNPSSQSNQHTTMYLQSSFQVCGTKAILSWNAYSYWGSPVEYEILVSQNGGPETVLATTSLTSYTDTTVVSGIQFCYRVRAREISTRRSSTSNTSCLTPTFPPPPAYSYLRKVSVVDDNTVYIAAYVDAAASVSGYQLQRSLSPSGPYTTVNSSTISGTSLVEFYDDVETTSGPYYYRILTLDSCGLLSKISNYGRTIIATATTADYSNFVQWISYQNWPAGVHHYDIYRSVNGVYGTTPIASLSSFFADSSKLDSIIDLYISDGEFCYFVEAIEAGGNPYAFRDTVRSNEVCVKVEPIIYIPNAFRPGGEVNTVWNPSNAFVQNDGYELRIFNRWGQTIFTTTDPKKGWDGNFNGKPAPIGVYVYQLKALTAEDKKIIRTGSLTLID